MTFTLLSISITVISIIISLISIYIAIRERKRKKSFSWSDVDNSIRYLSSRIRKNFKPDLIFTPSIKGGILVKYIANYFADFIPYIVGLGIPKKLFSSDCELMSNIRNDYISFETNKWYYHLPQSIRNYKNCNILIIDDYAMSGDFLDLLINELIKIGFKKDNIKTAVLIVSEICINNGKAPDYSWKTIDSHNISLPWGKPDR